MSAPMLPRVWQADTTEPRVLRNARALLIACMAGMMFSPPLGVLLQLLLFGLMLGAPSLRSRLRAVWRQPMMRAASAFALVIVVGAFYSVAGVAQGLGEVWAWRKLLMLPIALALFDDARWKVRLLHVFVVVSSLAALLSFAFAWTGHMVLAADRGVGIVLRNHATQGMLFAAAAFAAGTLALFHSGEDRRQRGMWIALGVLLVANIVLVTPGRSGYVVLVAAATTLGAGWVIVSRRSLGLSMLMAGGVLAVTLALLAASPLSRQRISLAVHEMEGYSQASHITSMGVRMYFWQNAISIIGKRPLVGWGTGGFEEAYRREVEGRPGVAGLLTSDPHNQFLKIAAEYGLIGFAVFLAFIASAAFQRPSREFRMLGLGVLLAWCATSLANSHFSTFSEGMFLYIWLGAMLAQETARAVPLERRRSP